MTGGAAYGMLAGMSKGPRIYDRILTVRFRTKDVQRIERAARKAKVTPTEWIRAQVQRIIGTFIEPQNENGERTRE